MTAASSGRQHLDRDAAIVPEVLREIDRGHASGADLVFEPVVIGQGVRDPRRHAAHGYSLHPGFEHDVGFRRAGIHGAPSIGVAGSPVEAAVALGR